MGVGGGGAVCSIQYTPCSWGAVDPHCLAGQVNYTIDLQFVIPKVPKSSEIDVVINNGDDDDEDELEDILRYIMLYSVLSCSILFCYIMLYHVVLCYIMFYYIMLYYVIL